MFTPESLMLAFVSGIFGSCAGATPAFIFCAVFTIAVQLLGYTGMDMTALNLYGSNLFFLPAVCFTGGAAASAFAAKRKHDINGYDCWRSLPAFNDPLVLIAGGLSGVLGYIVFRAAVVLNIPCDQGALSVVLVALLIRLTMSEGRKYDPNAPRILTAIPANVWLTHILMAGVLALGAGWFAEYTGIWNIGFGISGAALLFCMVEPNVPATHHLTLVAGYAMQMTHNLVIAVIFGIIAELICYIFTISFNNRCSTHIDPPAFAILLCSLILFTVF